MHINSSILLAILPAASTVSAATCRPGYTKAGTDEGVRCYEVKCNTAVRGQLIYSKPGRSIRECVKKCYNYYNCDSVSFEKETNQCNFYDDNTRFQRNVGYDGALLLDDVDMCY